MHRNMHDITFVGFSCLDERYSDYGCSFLTFVWLYDWTETASDGRYPADSLGSTSTTPSITRRNSWPTNRQPPPDASHNAINRKGSPPSIVSKKNLPPSRRSTDQAKKFEDSVTVTVAPDATPVKMVTEEKLLKEGSVRERLEARRVLFQKTGEKSYKKLAGPKSGSRVVPYNGDGDLEETAETEDATEEFQSAHKDEDLSKIRMQLVQIENQQASLLNLLQVVIPCYNVSYVNNLLKFFVLHNNLDIPFFIFSLVCLRISSVR